MARRSQCSSAGDNPLDPNYLPPHYREEYRLAIDALVEEDLDGYYQFLQKADVVDFLSSPEIQYIQEFVRVPQRINQSERFVETCGDGSSDTYWPIHSDMDAPLLDLGWPQLCHFIGPTEVTTLVNPPEPEMPSIKEQARRLIKNAQQVIAIAMDMFTDVDIFHDVLSAAMRNVAVYILLDELNAHHFVNMVANCRVNLQSIQFLRVRTVSGITYHCRSGKSFKGQMMDHFLLTDCRAVLSGNYSFMWSFEKLHRCMAHLFLGQLVSTFDEEFRILYAQSQPLIVEDMFPPMEDLTLFQKRQYPSERRSFYREPKKFLQLDAAHAEEWPRHSYDDRLDVDWRMMPLKRKELHYGPADLYGRSPFQQSRIDPSLDQGLSRIPMLESPYLKRHSFAEGVHSRSAYPFLQQQVMPEPENQAGQFYRQQQPAKEGDYSSYDKFWNQNYLLGDQFPEPSFSPEIEPPDNFDPIANYFSSTGEVDLDQGSDKLPCAADLPLGSSFPRRLSLGQPYPCQTSPTPSNPTEQKPFFLEPNIDRKDPMVKRGLRDWRIRSYLSTYENKGDEGPPLGPSNMSDPFEEPPNVIHQLPGTDVAVPKIPNVREFKVPAVARASQMPGYVKTTPQEQPKNLPDEPSAVTTETKTTPTPSDSSATTELDKVEEAEQKEVKPSVFQREDSFRRKYNVGVQRSSRLRSSLIFSSLEQQRSSQDAKTIPGQQDEEGEKSETVQKKQPLISQALIQRRAAREPFEWSRYVKSATFDNSSTESSKPDDGTSKAEDKDPSKDENSKDVSGKVQELIQQPGEEQPNSSPSVSQSKPSDAEVTKAVQPTKQPMSQLSTPMYLDMNDADMRLMFFKELAAKRKAEKSAQAEKGKEKGQIKPPAEKSATTIEKEESRPQEAVKRMRDTDGGLLEKHSIKGEKTLSTQECNSLTLEAVDEPVGQNSHVEIDPNTSHNDEGAQTRVLTNAEMTSQEKIQATANLSDSVEPETPQGTSQEEPKLSNPAVQNRIPSHPATTTDATAAKLPSLAQSSDEDENLVNDSTSKELSLLVSSSVAALDANKQSPDSGHSVPSVSSSQHPESQFSLSNPPGESSTFGDAAPDSGLQTNLKPSFPLVPVHPEAETLSSESIPEDSNSTPTSISYPNEDVPVNPPSQLDEETSEQSPASASQAEGRTLSAVGSVHEKWNLSQDADTVDSEPVTTSSQPTAKTDLEESCAPTWSEQSVPESENNSIPEVTESKVLDSSENLNADSTPISLNHSSPESGLSDVVDLGSKPRSDQIEKITPPPAADHTSVPLLAETIILTHPDLAHAPSNEKSNSSQDTCPAVESGNGSVPQATGEEPGVPGSLQDDSNDRSKTSHELPESCLPEETDLESKSDQNEKVTPPPAADHPSESSIIETNSLAHPKLLTHAPQSQTTTGTFPQESPRPSPPPSEHQPTGPVSSSPLEIVSCSPQIESDGLILPPSEMLSDVAPAREKSNISLDTCPAVESGNGSVPRATGEEPGVHGSPQDDKADSSTTRLDHTLTESCLSEETDLEMKSGQDRNTTPASSAADHPSKPSLVETNSLELQSETVTSLGGVSRPEQEVTGPVTLSPVDTVSCSPLTESVLSDKTDRTLPTSHGSLYADVLSEQVTTDSGETPLAPSVKACSPNEPSSKVTIKPESVPSESLDSEPNVPAANGRKNTENEESQENEMHDVEATDEVTTTSGTESACLETASDQVRQKNGSELPDFSSDEVIPTSPQTKQPKSSQSRYHSSTVNVISSSNLRDDTKLLLEQISANSQSRNDPVKESPVTDDEKEDKNAKREKEIGWKYLSRGQAKSNQERDKLLERIQSMRKERKVYSRFEMAP